MSQQNLQKGRKKDDQESMEIYGDKNHRNLSSIIKLKTRQVKLSNRIGSLNNSGHQISGFSDFDSSSNFGEDKQNDPLNSMNLKFGHEATN